MKQLVTEGIILSRIDYGEADRILTVLTPDHGKLRLMAKGVRKVKSKLAGGIELFSVSSITFIQGRGGIGTLVSARLDKHYGAIVTDLDRTMLGYELISQLHKITEDQAEVDYFDLMHHTFEALNDDTISLPLIELWFAAQLLRLGGHSPNLTTDTEGNRLDQSVRYDFDAEAMTLRPRAGGRLSVNYIKYLRLIFTATPPAVLVQVQDEPRLTAISLPLVQTMVHTYVRR